MMKLFINKKVGFFLKIKFLIYNIIKYFLDKDDENFKNNFNENKNIEITNVEEIKNLLTFLKESLITYKDN